MKKNYKAVIAVSPHGAVVNFEGSRLYLDDQGVADYVTVLERKKDVLVGVIPKTWAIRLLVTDE